MNRRPSWRWGSLVLALTLAVVCFNYFSQTELPSKTALKSNKNINFIERSKFEKPQDFSPLREDPFEHQADSAALALANQFIIDHPALFPIQSYHQLALQSVRSPLGTRVSYQVYQDDIPLIGMQIDLMVSRSGRIRILSNEYHPVEKVQIDSREWLGIEEILNGQGSVFRLNPDFPAKHTERVKIWVSPYSPRPELVYVVSVLDEKQKQKMPGQALFSVTTGQLVARHFPRSEFK